jgi:hypothetical protein
MSDSILSFGAERIHALQWLAQTDWRWWPPRASESAFAVDRRAGAVQLLSLGHFALLEKEFVTYNGARMIKGWPEKIEAAQLRPTILIGGIKRQRVRYGEEADDWGADQHPCHDCRVIKGQFHVFGCDGERCPVCGGQMISCECDD